MCLCQGWRWRLHKVSWFLKKFSTKFVETERARGFVDVPIKVGGLPGDLWFESIKNLIQIIDSNN